MHIRQRLNVQGVVQGVGFRPFVYGLATELALAGFVGNNSNGVFIEVEGTPASLTMFRTHLQADAPPLAMIEEVTVSSIQPTGAQGFTITPSVSQVTSRTFISPDLSICDECLQELVDPANRRFGYPFINCTNCGPRFTITKDIPYDRPLTTMAGFVMCAECQAEYDDPLDRRFHAQPNACDSCGPRVWFQDGKVMGGEVGETGAGKPVPGDAIPMAQSLIRAGGIVAIKGLGGFHLACDATNTESVQRLRDRKGRIDKPFAVMVPRVEIARQIAYINEGEEAQLTSRVRPIVLLKKREGAPLSDLVAPQNGHIGIMLPYTPLHHLLFTLSTPQSVVSWPCLFLIMTSGNLSSEPIVIDNDEAIDKLTPLADGFLLHNRPIHVPCDDSVIRVADQREYPIRRSRGYAPFPVRLPFEVRPTLAVGGELKSTFCLADGDYGFMSQHIGDMENLETLHAFKRASAHFEALFRIQPELLVCDSHPGYLSSRFAESVAEDRAAESKSDKPPTLVKVQHHHAHLASVMAEHGLDGSEPVIGFAFDGTGYGPDGAIWGGEVLIADYVTYRRAAHLAYVSLPGGDSAIKHPSRIALARLWAAGVSWHPSLPPMENITGVEQGIIRQQLARDFNTIPTSSMGRLFDAAAALAGVRQTVTYEGQAAIEFEAIQDFSAIKPYAFEWTQQDEDAPIQIESAPVLAGIVEDVIHGEPASRISARFHQSVVQLIVELAQYLRQKEGLKQVALSGGVFQNIALLRAASEQLVNAGFTLLTHQKVPANDGGLALGQVIIANAQFTD